MDLLFLISKIIKKMHIPAVRDSEIHKTAKVCAGSHMVNTKLDSYSYIGNFCTVINTSIGKFCSIADNCIIGGASHPIDWVSTSPVFHHGKNIMHKNFSNHQFKTVEKTTIGSDVWIGNNCLIKSGITIGNGAVIGMGSVVTKDVGPYEIWGGNPAKIFRKRFNDEIISELLDIKWWDNDDDILKKRAEYFTDVEIFINHVKLEGNNENITLG